MAYFKKADDAPQEGDVVVSFTDNEGNNHEVELGDTPVEVPDEHAAALSNIPTVERTDTGEENKGEPSPAKQFAEGDVEPAIRNIFNQERGE